MSIFDYLEDGSGDKQPIFNGVCPAVVTSINDPDNLGRVKVKLLNLDIPDYETDFIRVVTPMSGNQFGILFFPNVGDEVLVAFCGGDISRAYVLGSLWNKNFKTPTEIKEENALRIVKTKAGHELIFDDTDGKERIDVKTKAGLTISLEDEKGVITVKDKDGKNLVKIDSQNGAITIDSEKKINISAGSSKIILESNGNISMSADSTIKLKAAKISINGDSTEIKASGMLKMTSDGQTSVKGSILQLN